ncbi:MAG: hypothetical protein MJ058_04120 [Akkermansia sp.]|nr:hypothetical protein [Akkermansia sp.]
MITDYDCSDIINATAASSAGTAVSTGGNVIDLIPGAAPDQTLDSHHLLPLEGSPSIVVQLDSPLKHANSKVSLYYGSQLNGGAISSPTLLKEFAGSSSSTALAYKVHVSELVGKQVRYISASVANAQTTAKTVKVMVVLETPHNSGADID